MCHRQDPLLAPGCMCEACTLLRLLFPFPATMHIERQRRQQLCSTCRPWGSRRVQCFSCSSRGKAGETGEESCLVSAVAYQRVLGLVIHCIRCGDGSGLWRGKGRLGGETRVSLTFDGRALESCHWSTTPQPPGSKERSRADAKESPGLCCEEKQQQATHGRGSSSLTA